MITKQVTVRDEASFMRETRRRQLLVRPSVTGRQLIAVDASGALKYGFFDRGLGRGTFFDHPRDLELAAATTLKRARPLEFDFATPQDAEDFAFDAMSSLRTLRASRCVVVYEKTWASAEWRTPQEAYAIKRLATRYQGTPA